MIIGLPAHSMRLALTVALAAGGAWACNATPTDTEGAGAGDNGTGNGSAAAGGGMSGNGTPPPTYLGGWPIGDCEDDIKGTGFDVDDTAPDFSLLGQHGENVRLHSFCDRVVLLLGVAFW